MTKQQAIKALAKLGFTLADKPSHSRSYVWLNCPDGIVGLFCPADLLAELAKQSTATEPQS